MTNLWAVAIMEKQFAGVGSKPLLPADLRKKAEGCPSG